jgi:hypothetical protein
MRIKFFQSCMVIALIPSVNIVSYTSCTVIEIGWLNFWVNITF